jgi:hypothetical protein
MQQTTIEQETLYEEKGQMGGAVGAISNGTVKSSVKDGIISGFEALEQTGNYLPIIVLAVVIALVLFLVLGMTNVANGGGGRGSAL